MRDKKISKFRKWLIKKLGGVIPCYNKAIITNIRHTKTFESNLKFSFYDHQILVESNPFKADIKIKRNIVGKDRGANKYLLYTRKDTTI